MASWYEDREYDRPATEAEAHAEWHWNAGVPMGTGPCPWDACGHDEYGRDECDDELVGTCCIKCRVMYYRLPGEELPPCAVCARDAMPLPDFDPDDLPF